MRTLLTPEELLVRLHQLEQEANRERIIHWGPRTLDLDILFYDQEIIDMPDLHIPHIDLHNRDFVLVPMLALVDKGAAIYVKDVEAKEKLLPVALETIANPEKLQDLSKNIAKLALPDSATIIAKEVLKLIKK